ncbi:MAG: hypothetical protein MUO55_06345 [Candidatus Atribacteria bacterium]|nr:hypothetical protein [Candidatus Atribacteria bacterium]
MDHAGAVASDSKSDWQSNAKIYMGKEEKKYYLSLSAHPGSFAFNQLFPQSPPDSVTTIGEVAFR